MVKARVSKQTKAPVPVSTTPTYVLDDNKSLSAMLYESYIIFKTNAYHIAQALHISQSFPEVNILSDHRIVNSAICTAPSHTFCAQPHAMLWMDFF